MFFERLKGLRQENSISQKDLARALKVSQQTVASWEVGRTEPSNSALKEIADYFDVSTDYLLGRKNAPIYLSKKQSRVLGLFDGLDDIGKSTLMNVLGALNMSHSKQKERPKENMIISNTNNGNNFGVVGGNFNSNVTIKGI